MQNNMGISLSILKTICDSEYAKKHAIYASAKYHDGIQNPIIIMIYRLGISGYASAHPTLPVTVLTGSDIAGVGPGPARVTRTGPAGPCRSAGLGPGRAATIEPPGARRDSEFRVGT
jgi:hypothetical protein